MSSVETLGSIFAVALLLNLVWEFTHAWLYETCRRMHYQRLALLLFIQSIKDALWITVAYSIAPNLLVFGVLLFIFSYIVEIHAIYTRRWEYAKEMPRVFGAGLTPLFELLVTGLLTLYLLGLW
jgi:type III secretory pathway component EscU